MSAAVAPQPVFDGHNDVLLQLWRAGDRDGAGFLEGRGAGHLDLPRARAGGLIGGFFALYAPNADRDVPDEPSRVVDYPPIAAIPRERALAITLAEAAILARLARARPDALRVVRSPFELDEALDRGALAVMMHLEGCEAISDDLDELELLHAAGLRSLGPVWSRTNAFGTGVDFRFPASPDMGPGLTDAGKALVRACDELGVVVDLSHLNEAGFWDVARVSDRPLVATHSNVHALSPSSRNLTDRQLAAIAERGGIVGLNFAVGFLREDGRVVADTPLEAMLRHLEHLVERLGERGVALGSDFDGATIPLEIGDAAGLPALVAAMRRAGWGETLIDRVCRRNWIDHLRARLPS